MYDYSEFNCLADKMSKGTIHSTYKSVQMYTSKYFKSILNWTFIKHLTLHYQTPKMWKNYKKHMSILVPSFKMIICSSICEKHDFLDKFCQGYEEIRREKPKEVGDFINGLFCVKIFIKRVVVNINLVDGNIIGKLYL